MKAQLMETPKTEHLIQLRYIDLVMSVELDREGAYIASIVAVQCRCPISVRPRTTSIVFNDEE